MTKNKMSNFLKILIGINRIKGCTILGTKEFKLNAGNPVCLKAEHSRTVQNFAHSARACADMHFPLPWCNERP
jgi:hypothetical protein